MRLHHATWYLAALAAAGMPALAGAQGFGLNEIGSCAIARGFANTSAPCSDASMIFWNPGAITQTTGNNLLVGVAAIRLSGSFTEDTTGLEHRMNAPTEFPPHLFFTRHTAGARLGYGLGVYVPYGLTAQWPTDFPGRFTAQRASLQTVYAQPTIAYQLNPNWSVGGGPIVGHSALELKQSLDVSEQIVTINNPGTPQADTVRFRRLGIPAHSEFAQASLTGDGWGFGFTAAVRGKLSPTWEFGARYLSPVTFDYEGEAEFQQVNTGIVFAATYPGTPFVAGGSLDAVLAPQFSGGRLQSQSIRSSITHPAQAQAGVTYTGFANTLLSVEYAWLGWKVFKELQIDFTGESETTTAPDRTLIEDYNNSSVIRLGLEHRLMNPGFTQGWALRLGTTAASSAAPPETVTPLLPEQDRYTFNLGTGIPIGQRYALDLAYLYVGTWGSRGRLGERTLRSQTAEDLNNGFFALSANILSLSLKATF